MTDRVLKRRDLILNGNLWKAILLLAVPVAMNSLIQAMYNLVDTYFVASIGSMEVAAITFVGPINTFVTAISVGIGVGGTTLVAREIGRGEYNKAKSVSIQLIGIGAICGAFVAIGAYLMAGSILESAGATQGIIGIGTTYFKLTALSSPFVFINAAYVAIKRADGDTLKTMRVNMVAMGVKLVMTYFMIFHLDMGIKGLAYSTIISNMFVSAYGIYDLFVRTSMLQLDISNMAFTSHLLKSLAIISIPLIIEKSSISFSHIIMNRYVIDYGEKVLAGYGITNSVNSMFFGTVTGFAAGLAPIISQNLGAHNDDRAKKAIKNTFILSLSLSVISMIIFLPFRAQVASIFAKNDQEVLYHTINAMGGYTISVIPWAVFQVAIGVFQGTGNTKYSMVISLMRIYVFRLPIVMIFSKYTALGEYSIWYGMLVSNTLTAVVAWMFYRMTRKNLKLVAD